MSIMLMSIFADGPLRGGSPSITAWSLNPTVIVAVLLAGGLYAVGWGRLRSRARASLLPSWRAWCFGAGLLIVWLAILSPIGTLADYFLFAHMIEHLLLIMLVPPLLLLGAPLLVCLWAFPYNARRSIGRRVARGGSLRRVLDALTQPAIAAGIYLATLAVWHLPPLYDLAQGTSVIHQLEHLCFVTAGLLYWWPIIHPVGGRRRLGYGQTFLYLAPSYVEQTVLGALLTFAPVPIYAYYAADVTSWHLAPIADQQMAGVIMWVAGGIILTLQAGIVFIAWFNEQERQETKDRLALRRRVERSLSEAVSGR